MKLKITPSQLEEIEGMSPEFPYVLHRLHSAEINTPWHWHDEVEFAYIPYGTVKVHTTTHDYVFHAKEGFFTNTNVLCSMEPEGDSCLETHLMHMTFLTGHFRSIFETKYFRPILENKNVDIIEFRGTTEEQRQILNRLKKVSKWKDEFGYEFQIRNLFSEIWIYLFQEYTNHHIPTIDTPIPRERLMNMMSFIQKNYPRKITLKEIANAAALSQRECIRCFQNTLRKTPFEYLNTYRLDMAKKLLSTSTLSVTEIAIQTGFSGSAYFGKVFKESTGMTPGQFRKQALENKPNQ